MAKRPWIIRHVLTDAGANFSGSVPEVNAETNGIIRLFERETKGGLIEFGNDLIYDVRRILLDYKDATSFSIKVRHVQFPEYDPSANDFSEVETALVDYEDSEFNVVPPGGEYYHDSDLGRFMLMDLDMELMNDEQIAVYTEGAGEANLLAEVMARPILT